jgi:hypothetical protein
MRRLLPLSVWMLLSVCLNAQLSGATHRSAPSWSPVKSMIFAELALQVEGMNPPVLPGEVCQACEQNCVDAREQCKVSACLVNGGTPNGLACDSVANQQGWSEGLKACSDQEAGCANKCSAGVCKQ